MDSLRAFEEIKDMLRKDGWTEQICEEIYLLSSIGTNFFKDEEIIHLSIELNVDKETIDNMKG